MNIQTSSTTRITEAVVSVLGMDQYKAQICARCFRHAITTEAHL
jgi:hypothetical protein